MQIEPSVSIEPDDDPGLLERILGFDIGGSVQAETEVEKQCTECNGDGEIRYERDAEIGDLTDLQIKILTEADIYRESDGMTEEDMPDKNHGSGPGGPTPSEARARAMSNGPTGF